MKKTFKHFKELFLTLLILIFIILLIVGVLFINRCVPTIINGNTTNDHFNSINNTWLFWFKESKRRIKDE